MKNKIKKNTFTKLNETEMKHVLGGGGLKKIEIIVDGKVVIIWV